MAAMSEAKEGSAGHDAVCWLLAIGAGVDNKDNKGATALYRSETPNRDISYCCHPLTGVPCLLVGPRRAAELGRVHTAKLLLAGRQHQFFRLGSCRAAAPSHQRFCLLR